MIEGRIDAKEEELVSPRDFRREFTSKLAELETGDLDKLVLSKRGKFVGVVLSPEVYSDLLLHQMRPGRVGVEIDAYADSDD